MWRMKEMCDNCPFRTDGNQVLIGEERLEDIKEGKRLGQPFFCHKTVDYNLVGDPNTDDEGIYIRTGHEKECAGALEFAKTITTQERLDAFARILAQVEARQGDIGVIE